MLRRISARGARHGSTLGRWSDRRGGDSGDLVGPARSRVAATVIAGDVVAGLARSGSATARRLAARGFGEPSVRGDVLASGRAALVRSGPDADLWLQPRR